MLFGALITTFLAADWIQYDISVASSLDKLTKEEEEIYKLQHDLEKTVIGQQQSKNLSQVRKTFSICKSVSCFRSPLLTQQMGEDNSVRHPDAAANFTTCRDAFRSNRIPFCSSLTLLNLWVTTESSQEEMI